MALPERSPLAEYIGDGVYVDIRDYGDVVLTTEDGVSVQNQIVLEPTVLAAFERWIKYVKAQRSAQQQGDPE